MRNQTRSTLVIFKVDIFCFIFSGIVARQNLIFSYFFYKFCFTLSKWIKAKPNPEPLQNSFPLPLKLFRLATPPEGGEVDSPHNNFKIVTAAVFKFAKILVYYKINMLSNLR